MLNPGIKGSASVAVTAANTAAAMGSGEMLNTFFLISSDSSDR